MKKHFLLLMLMALLPLAGFADANDIKDAVVTLNRTELNYTGRATAPVIKSVMMGEDALTENTHYTVGYKDSEGTPIEASKVRNAGSYTLVLTGVGSYYTGTVETAFSINPGEVHLNVISPSKEYGAADPTELEYTWVDKSQIVGDDDVNSVVFTWNLVREAGDNIAEYKYTTCEATTPNYNVVIDNAASATLKITKVKLTMTLKSGALNRTFGDAQKDATIANFDATGLKGEDNLESLFGTSKKFGYQTDNNDAGNDKQITFDAVDNANYDVVISGTLTISPKTLNKADLTIGTYGSVTYKAAEYAPEISVTITEGSKALEKGKDYDLTKGTDADFKNAGTQNVTIAFKGNYAGTLKDATSFEINQKALYVYPSSGSSDYDGTSVNANAKSTVQFNGLEGEDKDTDEATNKIVVSSQDITNAGEYTLTVTVPNDNPLKGNYDIKKVNGKWTVNKLALTITAPTSSHIYGNAVEVPTLSTENTTMEGAINTDKNGIISDLTVAVEGVDAKTKVGIIENAVVLTAIAEPTTLKNYNYELVKANYTVTSAAYTVIAQNVNIIYGEKPTFTFIDGTGKEVKNVEFTLENEDGDEVTLDDAKNKGDYTIIIDKSSITVPDNYDKEFTTVTGTLNIAAKNLTIKPKPQKLPVGSTAGDLSTYDINNSMVEFVGGLVGTDQIAYELGFNEAVTNMVTEGKLKDGGNSDISAEWTAETKTWTGGIKVSAPAEIDADVYANANYDITWTATANIIVSNTLELTLDSSNEALLDIINAANGKEADVKFAQSKILAAGRWNTLVLPFATTVKAVSETLGYAVVDMLDVTNTDAEKVSLKLAFGDIPANTAFLVQPSEEIDLNTVTFEDVTISNANIDEDGLATGATDAAKHSLMGSYIKDGYFVTSKNSDEFYYSPSLKQFVNSKKEEGTKVAVFGAFLRAANANGARITTIDIQEPDGTTTSIKTVESAERNVEGWYNLNGVKIAEPTQKGIYIHNGKKVVIK